MNQNRMRIRLPLIILLLAVPMGAAAASLNLDLVGQVPLFLAQTTLDGPIVNFLNFIAKLDIVIGVSVVVAGGWRVHRGDTAEGLAAMAGGLIIALAVPIIRFLAGLGGTII